MTGAPIAGVGDAAVWLSGTETDGAQVAVLSVAESTSLGALVFRIAVGRPDLDSPGRLEMARELAASALPRFPGVEVEVEEPTLVTLDSTPVDSSGIGYVSNLRSREADGEWTLGEGLVATLGLFTGDTDEADVLRGGQVADSSATEIIAMARDYLDNGPDAVARTEIGGDHGHDHSDRRRRLHPPGRDRPGEHLPQHRAAGALEGALPADDRRPHGGGPDRQHLLGGSREPAVVGAGADRVPGRARLPRCQPRVEEPARSAGRHRARNHAVRSRGRQLDLLPTRAPCSSAATTTS